MTQPGFQVRRATVEDLAILRKLWNEARLPVVELERRLTEFQVAANDHGEVYGAVALQLVGSQGHIHSEAFLRPDLEDALRPLLWERFQALARNHGLVRFWTAEASPFWRRYAGFKAPAADELPRRPVEFEALCAEWLTMKLRDEQPVRNLDQEMELLLQAHQENLEQTRQLARRWKAVVTAVSILLFLVVVLAGLYLFRHRPVNLR